MSESSGAAYVFAVARRAATRASSNSTPATLASTNALASASDRVRCLPDMLECVMFDVRSR